MIGVLLVAGKGTRMRSDKPKVLFEINGVPMALRPLRVLLELCTEVIAVVGHQATLVESSLRDAVIADAELSKHLSKLSFCMQEKALGTGDAVRTAARANAKSFGDFGVLVFNGDLPLVTEETLGHFLDVTKNRALDSACLSFDTKFPFGFGRILRDTVGVFRGIREDADATKEEAKINEVNAGVYFFSGSYLMKAIEDLSSNNIKKEFYLTDLLGNRDGRSSEAVLWKKPEDLMGVNTTFELSTAREIAQRRLQRQVCEMHGVELELPSSTFIEETVRFEGPCYLGPGVALRGRTALSEAVVIEGAAQIVSSTIGKGTKIKWGCNVEGASIGENCSIGPMAHLRAESIIGNSCRVGNFVETKKTIFEDGAKAAHLSYLGDAEVGANANIGCGTITCNYDGRNKNKTVIGAGAFIGSDSQLIAPIRIGAGAYIASGTTVTKDVPDDALALARADFVIKEGYGKRLRKK